MADRKAQIHKQHQVAVKSQIDNKVRLTWQSSFAKVSIPLASGKRDFIVKYVDYRENPSQKCTVVVKKLFSNSYSDGGVQAESSAEPHYFIRVLQHHSRIELLTA